MGPRFGAGLVWDPVLGPRHSHLKMVGPERARIASATERRRGAFAFGSGLKDQGSMLGGGF